MGSVNWARVIRGGLLAGLFINVVEFILNAVVLAKDWEVAILALGRPPMTKGQIAMFFFWGFVLWGFLIGIAVVWLYAEIRPRYGGGPGTALCAGFAVWILGYFMTSVSPILMNLYPRRIFAIALTVGLVEVLAATQIGAWIYREPRSQT